MLKKGVITAFEPVLGYRAGAENMMLLAAQARIIGSRVPSFSNWLISANWLISVNRWLISANSFRLHSHHHNHTNHYYYDTYDTTNRFGTVFALTGTNK